MVYEKDSFRFEIQNLNGLFFFLLETAVTFF